VGDAARLVNMERTAANARHGRGQAMKTADEMSDDVISELCCDPQMSGPEAIGVAMPDETAAVTGHTSTYAEKLAAERAARRVYCVRAVANDLKLRTTISSAARPAGWRVISRASRA
jgi:osmotically-inducible protein OsmY